MTTWQDVETRRATAGDFAPIPYKMEAHRWAKRRGIHWAICKSCGLVALRNPFTEWATRMGCLNEYHKDHAAARARYTGERQ